MTRIQCIETQLWYRQAYARLDTPRRTCSSFASVADSILRFFILIQAHGFRGVRDSSVHC
jgi:hypothetical protein